LSPVREPFGSGGPAAAAARGFTIPVVSRPPSDYDLLRAIYERHRDDFAAYVEDDPESRGAKIMVPIDIPQIASGLGVDTDSVFGRLYFHLEPIYGGEPDASGTRKVFFTPVAGPDKNAVNFPLLEAVLAGLWQQRNRDLWTLWLAVISLGVAVGSLVVSLVAVGSA
jgi:hypothetical protein